MTDAIGTGVPRASIPDDQLSYEQKANLEKLRGIGSAINSTLAERGIEDVMVYTIQFGPRPEPEAAPSTTEFDGPTVFPELIRPEPEPIGMPPPGGCYCTDCDDQGRCWSYCCRASTRAGTLPQARAAARAATAARSQNTAV